MFDPSEAPTSTMDADHAAALPTERLEAEMMTLAGHLAAATCSFLLLVAEFDRREGHREWEALSTAHWLNWRCGVGMSAAREQVRVARRLSELPTVCSEFAAGRLSYSKVRAITRVAHPDIEEALVRMAQSATAAHLDRACAALRRTQDYEEAERELRENEHASRERRGVSWYRSAEGDLMLRARIPAEDAETLLNALHAATTECDTAQGEPVVPLDHRRADALVDLAAAYLAQPEPGEPAMPEIVAHIDASAAAAMTRPARLDTRPEAASAAEPGVELPPLHWADPVPWPARTARDQPLSFAAVERLCCDAGVRFVATLPDGTELNLGRHQRTVNRAQRRALLARDTHCRFPGCTRRSRLHAHHIIHWEHGGRTDMENLLMLCPAHHRAVHEGGWSLTGTATSHTFTNPREQTIRPDAPPLNGSTAELVHEHRAHGLDIALHGAGGRWHGEAIDWDCFFAAFAN